jgi:hypothetical protein
MTPVCTFAVRVRSISSRMSPRPGRALAATVRGTPFGHHRSRALRYRSSSKRAASRGSKRPWRGFRLPATLMTEASQRAPLPTIRGPGAPGIVRITYSPTVARPAEWDTRRSPTRQDRRIAPERRASVGHHLSGRPQPVDPIPPRSWATQVASCTRVASPSFARMFEMWASAVRSPITSASAIWRLLEPCATSSATSRSRAVSGLPCLCATLRLGPHPGNALSGGARSTTSA